ncbi:hypothetical protein HBH69_001390 [Parastagonospora nodorum]|nr:hypothetical protein HBH42_009500 [Parastagonospora nodorum]KAH5163988.1 hypothetical protein HBH69_001390 [Parastagonospora nodorum]KAH6465338.1 hypothetical protein HBI57_042090 [Parastagonospora nodorum]KAH6476382.1 hypothetical protein HBI58_118860 [Parastagonospora nodorum]
MTANDTGFESMTGALESDEPTMTPTPTPTSSHQAPAPPPTTSTARDKTAPTAAGPESASTAPMKHQTTLAGARSRNASGTPSPKSPLSSRDASPARPHQRAAPAAAANPRAGLRSRKNSINASPSRGPSPAGSKISPSATPIPRAQSASSIPQLPQVSSSASSADTIKAPRPMKPTPATISGDGTPHWPISPRLKSPPPTDGRSDSRSRANSIRNQFRKPETQSTPAIVVQSSSPGPATRILVRDDAVASDSDEPAMSVKAPSRGASGAAPKLETVQESSLPTTPGFDGIGVDSFVSSSSTTSHKTSDEERNDVSSSKVTEDLSSKNNNNNNTTSSQTGSGSDSGSKAAKKGKMQEQRSASAQRPHHISAKPSLSSLSTRSATQPPLRNMTVETETVPSVAQSTIGNQERSASGRVDGSLRLKPSNETIRPKKERKPAKRKAPSINAGTASSKADVFEQKVASAVDEADSSDSDATFIYESNPQPEQQPHRSRHHHSRTPSMTSLASLADPRLAIRDSHKNPNKKSSMKFTNSYNNPGADPDAADRGDGTVRIGSGRATGGSHHHHIGRHGQGRGGLGHLLVDSDSFMAQSSRTRGPSSRQASQPNSPRLHSIAPSNGHSNGSKKHGEYSTYDMDAEHAADDERTPLISSRGSQRIRTPRRRNSFTIRVERRHQRGSGWCRRFAGCLVLSILLMFVIFSSVGLVFATTKPLTSVIVQGVQNVIASQDEIMLDLIVDAVNPNIIGVTVADMDVIIFAKSKHVGSDKWWRHHGEDQQNNQEDWKPVDDDFTPAGIDEGTDPIEGEPRTMSLGRILHFDSPLTYEGSFFARKRTTSIGEIRLSHPGNKTEVGGPDRWEEVLQYPFELIVRGNFKYQLPLSTRSHTVPVTASYYYDPDAEKKKLKLLDPRGEQESEEATTPVLPKALGRYDRRAFAAHPQ